MNTSSEQKAVQDSIDLKDPVLAAFLAWLFPGLGHLYQKRIGKAVLFFVCIFGTFVWGCYLGGSKELGWGRVVYFSWPGERKNKNEPAVAKRWPYICQVGIGMPALPALGQAWLQNHDYKVWFHGFMAPPSRDGVNADQPTESELHRNLHRFFELGTVFTMIAGLLNILAIYDAWGGPVFTESKKEKKEEGGDKATEKGKAPA